MNSFTPKPKFPIYLSLSQSDWERKINECKKLISPCVLCGRRCKAKRTKAHVSHCDSLWSVNKAADLIRKGLKLNTKVASSAETGSTFLGFCQTADKAIVASYGAHFGEEPPLVGRRGSGTIFFAGCNLKCSYCQNFDIAHFNRGEEISDERLSEIMLRMQQIGCHNVNLVTPTHVVPNIVSAVRLAAEQGLKIPLVYNTGGYDNLETIKLLDGIVDIYMPDMKYSDKEPAKEFSLAPDYPRLNFEIVREMYKQVGDLKIGTDGIATRGLLVRHLVLPGNMAGTERIMNFLAENISKNTYVNIMAQYRPYYQAIGHPVIGRRITNREYRRAIKLAKKAGLTRVQAL